MNPLGFRAIAIALLGLLAAGRGASALPAAEPTIARRAPRLIAVNDDGFSAFYDGRYRSAADLQAAVAGLGDATVSVLEWCVTGGSRVNFPSQVAERIGAGLTEYPRRGDQLAAETLARFAQENVDSLAVVANACRKTGLACYASIRMNGDYPQNGGASWGDSLARYFNSGFWWQHPEWRVRGPKGEDRTKLSYAFAGVREFRLALVREVAQRDIAGVNLDFQRHPDFFGYEEPMLAAFRERFGGDGRAVAVSDPRWGELRAAVMTSFLREVRTVLDAAGRARGRRLGLSVRIDWKAYRTWGCDVEAWLRAGWLDYLVVGQRGLGGYEFDLAPFVQMARGTGCAVLFGEEAVLQGHDRTAAEDRLVAAGQLRAPVSTRLTPAQYEARAARWYAAGADGIHLFNETDRAVMRALGAMPLAAP